MSGIIGVFSFEEQKAFPFLYYGLYALQHRGQGYAGMGTVDTAGNVYTEGGEGLISDNFGSGLVSNMPGKSGIGFVQYEFARRKSPNMPIAYKDSLFAIDGKIENENFQIEELLDVLAGDLLSIQSYLQGIDGKFIFIFMNKDRFIVYKNTDGIKPLALGRRGNTMIASSETCGIDAIGGEIIRELQPGELYIHTRNGAFSQFLESDVDTNKNLDAFEFIYTARPDSVLDGVSVYEARYRMGKNLWQEDKLDNAVVIGAPESGIISSLGYAKASGLLYQQGFVRNRYIGRTFIKSSDLDRQESIHVKLMPIRRNIQNKTVILVDDSIVRGNTIKRTVKSLKSVGAQAVHVRIASPAIVNSDSIAVDIPDKKDLIAYGRTNEELCELIGCESLKFLSIEGFHRAVGRNKLYEPYFKE